MKTALQIFQKVARIDVILVSLAAIFCLEGKSAARETNEIQEVKDRPDVFWTWRSLDGKECPTESPLQINLCIYS